MYHTMLGYCTCLGFCTPKKSYADFCYKPCGQFLCYLFFDKLLKLQLQIIESIPPPQSICREFISGQFFINLCWGGGYQMF